MDKAREVDESEHVDVAGWSHAVCERKNDHKPSKRHNTGNLAATTHDCDNDCTASNAVPTQHAPYRQESVGRVACDATGLRAAGTKTLTRQRHHRAPEQEYGEVQEDGRQDGCTGRAQTGQTPTRGSWQPLKHKTRTTPT